MSNNKEEQLHPDLRQISPTKQELRLTPVSHVIPKWMELPIIVHNPRSKKIEEEVVINFWDFGTVEDDDVFQSALTNTEILPCAAQIETVKANDIVTTITAKERREAIAKIVAKIAIRVSNIPQK